MFYTIIQMLLLLFNIGLALRKTQEEYDKYTQTHLTTAEQGYFDVLNKEIKEINK